MEKDFIRFSKSLNSVQNCQELVQSFKDSEYSFTSILLMLYGHYWEIEVPEPNSCPDLILKDYVYEPLFSQSIADLLKLSVGFLCALAKFAARYDDEYVFYIALKIYERRRYYSSDIRFSCLSSLEIFKKLTSIRQLKFHINRPGAFHFYTKNFRPHPRSLNF